MTLSITWLPEVFMCPITNCVHCGWCHVYLVSVMVFGRKLYYHDNSICRYVYHQRVKYSNMQHFLNSQHSFIFFANYFNPRKSCVLLHVTITQHCSVPENDAGHKVNLWPGRKLVFDSDLKLGLSSSTHYKENKDTTLQSLMIAKRVDKVLAMLWERDQQDRLIP